MEKLIILLMILAGCSFGQCSLDRSDTSGECLGIEAKISSVIFSEDKWTKVEGALKGSQEVPDKVPLCAYIKNDIVKTPRGTYKCLIGYFNNVNVKGKRALVCENLFEVNAVFNKSRLILRILSWFDNQGNRKTKKAINLKSKWYDIASGSAQEIIANYISAHHSH